MGLPGKGLKLAHSVDLATSVAYHQKSAARISMIMHMHRCDLRRPFGAPGGGAKACTRIRLWQQISNVILKNWNANANLYEQMSFEEANRGSWAFTCVLRT